MNVLENYIEPRVGCPVDIAWSFRKAACDVAMFRLPRSLSTKAAHRISVEHYLIDLGSCMGASLSTAAKKFGARVSLWISIPIC